MPPENVESGEVAVHKLGIQDPLDIALELSPDPSRGHHVEIDVGEPRSRLVAVADERHAVAVLDPLDGRRHRDTGEMQLSERDPLVRHPSGLEVLLAEPRSLLDRAALMTTPLAPHAGVEIVVAKATLKPRLEPLLGHEAGACRTGPGDEVHLALFAGLEHAEVEVFVGCVGKPVAWEQCGHASSMVGDRRLSATVARAALEGARRSSDTEAGGVTRDSNAHLRPPDVLSTDGRGRRVEPTRVRIKVL